MLHRKNPVTGLNALPLRVQQKRRLERWPLWECGNPTNSHGKTLMNTIHTRISLHRFLGCAALGSVLLATSTTRGADIIFTIQPGSHEDIISVDDVYGAHEEQSPGSMTAPLTGHFLTRFDPSSGNPTSIQFVGGDGYYQVGSNQIGLPGVAASPGTPAQANLTGQTHLGEVQWAVREPGLGHLYRPERKRRLHHGHWGKFCRHGHQLPRAQRRRGCHESRGL